MSFEQRQVLNYFSTSLTVAASVTDTTMRASMFTGLDTDFGSKYLPLVLHDDALGVYEIVAVVAHTVSSDTVTVVRGREGTTARAWPAGTRVDCAPTAYDMLLARNAATLPPDPYIGMRASRLDRLDVLERVNGYWGPSVGAGIASDQKGNMLGATPPNGATFLLRMGTAGTTTDANGKLSCTFQTPFPNACHTFIPISTFLNAGGNLVCAAISPSGADVYFLNGDKSRYASASASYAYLAFGW
jgi:hypothetical protein